MSVSVLWDASSNVEAIYLADGGPEHWDFSGFGGLVNNAGSGKIGSRPKSFYTGSYRPNIQN